jgi:hypothetical protein
MRRITVLAAVVVAALAVVGTANAGLPDGPGPWADYVVSNHQGCAVIPPDLVTCRPVRAERSNPQAAVGPAENLPGPDQNVPAATGTFYSLGFSGLANGEANITLGFDNPICNGPGADLAIEVREVTREPYPNETVKVYVSQDNVNYFFAGTVTKDASVAMPAAVSVANFVRLVDISNPNAFGGVTPDADGFDLDAVRSLCDATTIPPGKLEICKASTNGMTGKLFQYSVAGGAPISVRGGRCSGPITVPSMTVRIVELQSDPATDLVKVAARPASRLITTDLPNRTAWVYVVPGSTASNETLVTFTNQPAGGNYGNLKICKITESPVYLGRGFSFRVNGGPLITTEASDALADPSTYTCRLAGTFQVGTKLTVTEQLPAGAEVAWIDTEPGDRLLDLNTETASAQVLIGAGVTTLIVDNEPIPPPQAGYIEICKDAALVEGVMRPETPGLNGLILGVPDPEVTGLFTFTVTPSDGNSFDVQAGVGQCTEPIKVAAGIVHVTEHQRPNHTLVDVFTLPEDRLLAQNLINATVDVEVPVSSSANDETQVHFVNQRDRAQLKLCKALGAGSGDLVGQRFWFQLTDVTDPDHPQPAGEASVVAGATTQCVIVGNFPVGNTIAVKEVFSKEDDPNTTFDETGQYIDVSGAGPVTIAPGVNSVTVTNTARGRLEICKLAIRGIETQPKFQFLIDNGGTPVVVQAGKCSPAISVPVGTHTVTERNTQPNYELDPYAPGDGIVVYPADREVARNIAGRTVTVSVPYATSGETVVTFINRIKRGLIKVCKTVQTGSLDAIGTTGFSFDVSVNGGQPITVGPISNGECVFVPGDFPILNSLGNATSVFIQEHAVTGVVVTDITYQGTGTFQGNTLCGRSTQYLLGAGVNISTFVNAKGVPQGC